MNDIAAARLPSDGASIYLEISLMPVHFSQTEFDSRIAQARASLAERDLEGLLMFAPESHYYLCGFDTFGFAMF